MDFFDSPYKTKILDDTTGSFLENYIELKVVCDAGATVVVNRYENNVIVDTINVGVVSSGERIVNLPCFGEWASSATLNGTTITDSPHLIINEVRKYESDVCSVSSKLHFTRQSENSNVLSPAYSQNEFLLGVSNNLSKYSFSNNSITSGSCTQQEITEATTNTLSWFNGVAYSPDIGYDDVLLSNNMKIKNAINGALFSCLDNTEYTRFKNFFTLKISNNIRPYIVPVSNSLFVLIYYSNDWYASLYDINDLTSAINTVELNSVSYSDVNNHMQISKLQNSSGNFLIIWKRSKLSNDILYYDVLEILSNSISLKNSTSLSVSLSSNYFPRSFPLQYNNSFILFASKAISGSTYQHRLFKLDMANDFTFSATDQGEVGGGFPSSDITAYDFIKMDDGYVIAYNPYSSSDNEILIYILEITSNFTCSLIHSYTSYILAEDTPSSSGYWENTQPFPGEGPYPVDWPISSEWATSSFLSKINHNTIIFLCPYYQHDYGYYAETSAGGDFYDSYIYYTNGYIFKYKNGQLFY